jgi:hypothetical protein
MKEAANNKNEEQSTDWKEKIEGYLGEFAKHLAGGFVERVKERVREIIVAIQKNVVGMFLMLLGFIFVLIAFVIFINELIGISDGIGYAVVGVVVLLLGLIIIKK